MRCSPQFIGEVKMNIHYKTIIQASEGLIVQRIPVVFDVRHVTLECEVIERLQYRIEMLLMFLYQKLVTGCSENEEHTSQIIVAMKFIF